MGILLAGILYLLISEPGIAVYPVLDRPPSRSCGAQPSVRAFR